VEEGGLVAFVVGPVMGGDVADEALKGVPQQIETAGAGLGGDSPMLLASLPATAGSQRLALLASLVLLAAFAASVPFARIPLTRVPAFIALQEAILLINDLITAALLFAQYSVQRVRGLGVLAAGYLFTALIVIPHALTYPGVVSETGLFGAGPQTTAWIYIAWRAALPLTVIFYVLRRGEGDPAVPSNRKEVLGAILAATAAAAAVTFITVMGQDWLPDLMNGNRFGVGARVVVGLLLMLTATAWFSIFRRRSRSTLDLWLMVVMLAWLLADALGSFISGGRYDLGYYAGRVYSMLGSVFVLLVLLYEMTALYGRVVQAAKVERRERERRIIEMQAVLAHLGRVSELGQIVSSLIHEVNQPLTAISNYAAAAIVLAEPAKSERLKQVLEGSAEQARRAAEIIRHLRELIAKREHEKQVNSIPNMLNDAVRLGLLGIDEERPTVETHYAEDTSVALFDRVQIEQVVFNLVRNAAEAMSGTSRRSLTVATALTVDNTVEVSIADTGPGLPPEVRTKLFEPFVTTKPSGLGVGLSICRVIIESHGGRLQAEDRPAGGTVFRFTLPGAPEGQSI
jgi:signal transduction histidine kinase